MAPPRVVARLVASLVPAADGCLVSAYSVGSHGYSQIGWYDNGVRTMALGHRVAWEAAHGPIPTGLTIDHKCRNRRCCNVGHLRLLSNVDNARANGNSLKTHCPQGHPYDRTNTYIDRRGHRRCRACAEESRRAA